MRLWRLDRIVSVDLLDRGFARREDFSLEAYATQSFGVFQEKPVNVVLRFTAEAAEDAAGWTAPCWCASVLGASRKYAGTCLPGVQP